MSILWIISLVVLVLALLGVFSRSVWQPGRTSDSP